MLGYLLFPVLEVGLGTIFRTRWSPTKRYAVVIGVFIGLAAFVLISARMSSQPSFYDILGCPATASHEELKRSFRTASLKYHPDKNPGNKNAAETFLKVKEAQDLLSDPQLRDLYDRFGPIVPKLAGGRSISDTTLFVHAAVELILTYGTWALIVTFLLTSPATSKGRNVMFAVMAALTYLEIQARLWGKDRDPFFGILSSYPVFVKISLIHQLLPVIYFAAKFFSMATFEDREGAMFALAEATHENSIATVRLLGAVLQILTSPRFAPSSKLLSSESKDGAVPSPAATATAMQMPASVRLATVRVNNSTNNNTSATIDGAQSSSSSSSSSSSAGAGGMANGDVDGDMLQKLLGNIRQMEIANERLAALRRPVTDSAKQGQQREAPNPLYNLLSMFAIPIILNLVLR